VARYCRRHPSFAAHVTVKTFAAVCAVIIHRRLHYHPQYSAAVSRHPLLWPSASSVAVCTVIIRRRVHCHPTYSTAVSFHRHLLPCPSSCQMSYSSSSAAMPNDVCAVICRRVHCHPPPCFRRHPPPPCPLSSAAVSTVILGRRIPRHQTSCPPSSSDVSTVIPCRHIHRHPFSSPPVIRCRLNRILRRHVQRRPLPSPHVIRRLLHRYPPPPCHPSSITISTRHPPPFLSLSSAVGVHCHPLLAAVSTVSSSGAVTATSSAVISRRVHSHPLLFLFSSAPGLPCLLSFVANANILHLAS